MRKSLAALVLIALLPAFPTTSPNCADSPGEDGDALKSLDLPKARDALERRDYDEANRLIRPPADRGDASARVILGLMCESGLGVPKSPSEAVGWYRMAAERGYSRSQGVLGGMYYMGHGVPRDYVEAERWTRPAATAGIMNARFLLGIMYNEGNGVPQDYVLAYMWFNLAAALHPPSGGDARERIPRNREYVASMMTPEQIAEAQKPSREWKPKAP